MHTGKMLRGIGATILLLAMADVCACSTMQLVKKFNSGLLDSAGDPCRDPVERRRTLARQIVTHEFMDGYFSQADPDGAVEKWLDTAGQHTESLIQAVHGQTCALGNNAGVECPSSDGGVGAASLVDSSRELEQTHTPGRTRAKELGAQWHGELPSSPICAGPTLDPHAAATTADMIRFDAAAGRATKSLAALVVEGIIDFDDIRHGAKDAFAELHNYLGRRGWHRRFDRRTLGLVVEGGATTGLYSAGVVWTALNLVAACRREPSCGVPDIQFDLVSGTSTGAMISVATEVFNAATSDDARKTALDNFVEWFTCLGVADLYCVRDGDATSLLRDQRGMVEFDGIQSQLTQGLQSIDIFSNKSELVLNTVDFRTGALLDLSDQNELGGASADVVQGAIASAVLPFIANPVPHLPSDWKNPSLPSSPLFTYLDGGIRSELPILPLARRGAERVLIVASSPSITGDTTPLKSALDIAIRYIDVSTGGVTEGEIAHAERHVESVRLAEIELCKEEEQSTLSRFGGSDPHENLLRRDAFCQSDWANVCTGKEAKERKAAVETRVGPGSALDLTDSEIWWTWGERSFFRNAVEVQGLHGYSFDATKTRHLFAAGAEAARERCGEIATVLGIPRQMVQRGGALYGACSPPLNHQCRRRTNANDLRTCTGPKPSTFRGECQ